jgi:hypothetical protein
MVDGIREDILAMSNDRKKTWSSFLCLFYVQDLPRVGYVPVKLKGLYYQMNIF